MAHRHTPRPRRARRTDIAALAALESHFPTDRLCRANLRHLLTRAHADVLVLAIAGALAGNAIVLYRKNSRVARLYSLVVDPKHRGHGLGDRLVAAAEAAARKRRCRTMSLEVRPRNRAARALYLRRGYSAERGIDGFYEDGSDALRLIKNLTPS